jgi:hypothetical protein
MGKKEIKEFDYQGQNIVFEFEEGISMVNATQMAKLFKKKTFDFLRLKQTKAFIEAFEKRGGNSRHEIVRVVQYGDAKLQGTWMNERLALKFAAWLNPYFELWVYDRVHELLTTGKTELKTESQVDIKTLEFVFQKIKDNAMEIHYLSDILEDLKNKNEEEE